MEKTEEKADKTAHNTEEIKDARLVYEVSYLLLPTLDAGRVAAEVAGLKSAIESAGGELISDENPVLIDLAYQMVKVVGTTRHKCDTGHFGWMKFDMEQGDVLAVKKVLDASDTIVRYLLIKTARENTLLTGKMNLKSEEKKASEMTEESLEEVVVDAEPAAAEEMDKSIDELVIA